MMKSIRSRLRWKRIIAASLLALLLCAALVTSSLLVFRATLKPVSDGSDEHNRAQEFTRRLFDWGLPASAAFSTIALGAWATRRVEKRMSMHGLAPWEFPLIVRLHGQLVGLIVGTICLGLNYDRLRSLQAVAAFGLPLVGGWLGAKLGNRREPDR